MQVFKLKVFFGPCLLILFLALSVKGQNTNIPFRNITSLEGLPTTSVSDVTQDSFGLIWIGTWDGVFRFDGHRYEKMAYGGRYVTADKKGGVWISQQTGKLAYYNSHTGQLKTYDNVDDRRFVFTIVMEDGNVLADSQKGVLKFNEELQNFELEKGQAEGPVYGLRTSETGNLTFFSRQGEQFLLGHRDASGKYRYEELPIDQNDLDKRVFHSDYPTFAFPYKQNGILIVNQRGYAIKQAKDDAWVFYKVDDPNALKTQDPVAILLKNDELWLNKNNSLARVSLESGTSITYLHDPADPNSILPLEGNGHGCKLFIDRQGVLWVTRFSYGISRLNLYESDFGLLKDEQGKTIPDVLSALELEDGTFWLGERTSNRNGLVHFDAKGKKILERIGSVEKDPGPGKSVAEKLSHPYPWALAKTSDGSIWVGTGSPGRQNGGLNRIRPGSDEITIFRHDPDDEASLPYNWIFNLMPDGKDRVWINTGDGLAFIDPLTEEVRRFSIEGAGTIAALMVDGQGDLLVGSEEKANSFFLVDHEKLGVKPIQLGIAATDKGMGVINSWNATPHQDKEGRIWFATNKGFGYTNMDYERFIEWYNYVDVEFPASLVTAISSDMEGKLWFGTDMGIVKFDPNTREGVRFGYERGLQGNLFHEHVRYTGPSGRIYFGGNGGMNVFNPSEIVTNPNPPEMVFTDILLDGVNYNTFLDSTARSPILVTEKITVEPEIGTMAFQFSAIHFGSAKNNTYQYKLEGFDKTWKKGGNNGLANYTNLPAGDYNFRIRGSNLDGVWSDGSKSISIKVLPPWYQTFWAYGIYLLLLIISGWQAHIYMKKRTIRKEREIARERELEQARKIEEAYTELKAAQSQLIQSEKMASLGELTAGIAHEIQNPLNFVNNFAEVSNELLDEMQEEIENQNFEEVNEIASDIRLNLEKINHHGKRADAIVKGMLQHSRRSDGKKEPTDINALADEYLRLAYHGIRAKDKSFNATLRTDFDDSIGKVNIAAQDMGRVILNLITNAFYAVDEKKRSGAENYEPTITVSSKKDAEKIAIKVADNGNGIPKSVLDKIFQPFFTTKPTGQGTGLGLSLSYDIVKAQGGDLKVDTIEGEGTTFIINLPYQV